MYSESVLLYILQHTAGALPCSSTGLSTDKIKAKDGTTRPATTDNEEKEVRIAEELGDIRGVDKSSFLINSLSCKTSSPLVFLLSASASPQPAPPPIFHLTTDYQGR